MTTERILVPRPIKPGDDVVVKFSKGSIPRKYQGAGWHDATVFQVGDIGGSFITVILTSPTKELMEVCGAGHLVVRQRRIHFLERKFHGTVVRKIGEKVSKKVENEQY